MELSLLKLQHDPFLPLVSAAMETEKIELVTAIAVAFARNPMILGKSWIRSTKIV